MFSMKKKITNDRPGVIVRGLSHRQGTKMYGEMNETRYFSTQAPSEIFAFFPTAEQLVNAISGIPKMSSAYQVFFCNEPNKKKF